MNPLLLPFLCLLILELPQSVSFVGVHRATLNLEVIVLLSGNNMFYLEVLPVLESATASNFPLLMIPRSNMLKFYDLYFLHQPTCIILYTAWQQSEGITSGLHVHSLNQ